MGTSQHIPVELVVNGEVVETKEITADGAWNSLEFSYQIQQSGWIAVRVYQSAHTNPIFVIVDGKPIMEKKSAAWCRAAVDQCWKMKVGKFREEEIPAAKQAYDHARNVFDEMAGRPR
jgi:hypothetical protein